MHSQTTSTGFDFVDFFAVLLTSSTWCIAQNLAASGIPARSGLVGTDISLLWSGFCDHSSLCVALRPSNRSLGDQKLLVQLPLQVPPVNISIVLCMSMSISFKHLHGYAIFIGYNMLWVAGGSCLSTSVVTTHVEEAK